MIVLVPISSVQVSWRKLAKLDQAKISVYEGDYERGDRFPPILLDDCGSFYTIVDGRHRFAAQRNLGWRMIEAQITSKTVHSPVY
jgi:hypothetical protein